MLNFDIRWIHQIDTQSDILITLNKGNVMNNYEKALQTILQTFHAKKVKEFRGHDGYGYNADIYLGKNKVAEVDEDGWGGGLRIDYVSDEMKQKSDEIIQNLPKCKWSEWNFLNNSDDSEFTWTHDLVFDAVATNVLRMRDFKKQMKKITFIQNNQMQHFTSLKHSQLQNFYQYNEGTMKLEEWLKMTEKEENMIVLNLLPENEAFDLYRKHS